MPSIKLLKELPELKRQVKVSICCDNEEQMYLNGHFLHHFPSFSAFTIASLSKVHLFKAGCIQISKTPAIFEKLVKDQVDVKLSIRVISKPYVKDGVTINPYLGSVAAIIVFDAPVESSFKKVTDEWIPNLKEYFPTFPKCVLRFAADNSHQLSKSQLNMETATAFADQICRQTNYKEGMCLFSIDPKDRNSLQRVLSTITKCIIEKFADEANQYEQTSQSNSAKDDALDIDDPRWQCRKETTKVTLLRHGYTSELKVAQTNVPITIKK